MLETARLLLHPWQHDGTGWTRLVADAATTTRLGRVRWHRRLRRSWFDWLRGQRLEVFETDDDALLMTLARAWGLTRFWDIYDADERRIGTLATPLLLDNEAGRRAFLDRDDGRILDPAARPLADFARNADGTTLMCFAADLEANPFLRMLLLGCVLTEDVPPRR